MGLGRERIAEEEDRRDLIHGHAAADDEVAPFRTMHDPFDVQAVLVSQHRSRAAGGDEQMSFEKIDVPPDKGEHLRFLFIVGDEGNSAGHGRALGRGDFDIVAGGRRAKTPLAKDRSNIPLGLAFDNPAKSIENRPPQLEGKRAKH